MLKFVDLFCGAGFGAYGAVKAGAKPLFAVDAWNIATDTYKANFPSASVLCKDLSTFDPSEVNLNQDVDVLLTSPECTSHSIARGAKPSCRKSQETASHIVPWLKRLEPNWLILENVRRMRKWNQHEKLVSEIEDAGYHVDELFLNSSCFGVPQARKRMFLVCNRIGVSVSESELVPNIRRVRSAAEILSKSGFESRPLYSKNRAASTLERAERAIAELGTGVPFLIVYYGSDYAGGWQPLTSPLRTITTLDRFGLVTWQQSTPYLRMLQPPELSRAMGASGFKLPIGSRRDKIKLIGNGVCSPVTERIFRTISKKEDSSVEWERSSKIS